MTATKSAKVRTTKPQVFISQSIEPRWDAISCLIVDEEPQEKSQEITSLLLYAKSYMFFHKLSLFRKGETARLYLNEPGESDLMFHRALLEKLISEGKELVKQIKKHGILKNDDGFTLEDIEATVEELQQTERQWHGKMPSKRKQAILQEVFGG
jgi:hypothetical protein